MSPEGKRDEQLGTPLFHQYLITQFAELQYIYDQTSNMMIRSWQSAPLLSHNLEFSGFTLIAHRRQGMRQIR